MSAWLSHQRNQFQLFVKVRFKIYSERIKIRDLWHKILKRTKDFHHTTDCWVISEEDALDLIN